MGRLKNAKYVNQRRMNNTVEWLAPKISSDSDIYSEIIEDFGLQSGIPYSEKKAGLWKLKEIMKETDPNEEENANSLAIVEVNPYNSWKDDEKKGSVFFRSKEVHVTGSKSTIRNVIQQDAANTTTEESNSTIKNLPRESSRKMNWHKNRRIHVAQKNDETEVKTQKDINLSCLVVCPMRKQKRTSFYGGCSCCRDSTWQQLVQHNKFWMSYCLQDWDHKDLVEPPYHEIEEEESVSEAIEATRSNEWNIEAFLEPTMTLVKSKRKRVHSSEDFTRLDTVISSSDSDTDDWVFLDYGEE